MFFYYIVIKTRVFRDNLIKVLLGVGSLFFVFYIFGYDKSIYRIDNVRHWMIRFLLFESMLLGAYFRQNKSKYINVNLKTSWLFLGISIPVYFISKFIFIKYPQISGYQIINQLILFTVLYSFMKCIMGIENVLINIPKQLKKLIEFIAMITLEIYVVQYVAIYRLENCSVFSINFIFVTTVILLSAYALNRLVKCILNRIDIIS